MAQIVLADDGIEFDGDTPRNGPLGGVESSIVNLVEEFAKRGHTVSVRNMCRESRIIAGVDWAPLFLNDKYNDNCIIKNLNSLDFCNSDGAFIFFKCSFRAVSINLNNLFFVLTFKKFKSIGFIICLNIFLEDI